MFRNFTRIRRLYQTDPRRQSRNFAQQGISHYLPFTRCRTSVFCAQKKPFILFELLITLSLISVIIAVLFSFLIESARFEKRLESLRVEIQNRAKVQTRLQSIFIGLDQFNREPCFFTIEKQGLISLKVIFDNGIDPNPNFSGSIVGKIFLDPNSNLCLLTEPLKKKDNNSLRKEILLTDIQNFEFEFLGSRGIKKKGKEYFVNVELAWQKHWPKLQGKVPSMIRLKTLRKQQKKPLFFAFLLPTAEPLVTFQEKNTL